MFYSWHKFEDPATGWLASKTSGWTADSFSGGLEVDFSAIVPVGTKAVRVVFYQTISLSSTYWRKSGDTNISNTPNATGEFSHYVNVNDYLGQIGVWLSSDYKVQFAAADVSVDLYISYPVEWLG